MVFTVSFPAVYVLHAFFTIFALSFGEILFSIENALMHPDPALFHQNRTAANWTQHKLIRTFADFQFATRSKPVQGPENLRHRHSAEFV